MPVKIQIFTFLLLMLGPFKIIGTLIAAFLGARILSNFNIPLPILALSGGIILFLVALLNIIKQFGTPLAYEENVITPTLNMALNPLAFPTIVTPYGIAAVIVFLALSPDLSSKLTVGAILGIVQVALGLMVIYNQFRILLEK